MKNGTIAGMEAFNWEIHGLQARQPSLKILDPGLTTWNCMDWFLTPMFGALTGMNSSSASQHFFSKRCNFNSVG